MKVMILLPLVLCCSAAPLSKGKGRKAKQLELVVASGYSSVSRAAPYKSDLQSSAQSLNHQSSFNTQASGTATSQQAFDDISPRGSATVANVGSITPSGAGSVSLITDNVDSENVNIVLSTSEDMETKSSADTDATDEIGADDAKILATTVILSSVNDKTEPKVEQEVVMDALAADNKNNEEFTALTQSLLNDQAENLPSNDLTSDLKSQTIEEVKTLPFSVATPITIDEDPETPVSLLESSAVNEEVGLSDPTEVAEAVTTVELVPEEVNNLPTEEEAQLDEFSSSIVLDSEPLPKMEDEVSIIELVPSDPESLFDLEGDIDVNDLVKRSNSKEAGSEIENEGNQSVFINPLTKPIFEALPGSGRDLQGSEIVDSELEAVIVEADEPVGTEIPMSSEAEPQIVVREAKPECIDDTLAKEDYKVAEGQPAPIEEIEREVITDV